MMFVLAWTVVRQRYLASLSFTNIKQYVTWATAIYIHDAETARYKKSSENGNFTIPVMIITWTDQISASKKTVCCLFPTA